MNMQGYWLKIAGKALIIFAVGYGVISAVRAGKREVVRVVETSADVTVPLPFVPFSFDGARAGTFRNAVFHRSAPNQIEGIDVTVRLSDLALLSRLDGCHATVDDPTRLNERSSFRCVSMDSSMQEFGKILIETRGADGKWVETQAVPLVLPRQVAQDIQDRPINTRTAARYDARRMRQLGDSMRILSRELGRAQDEAERMALTTRIEALQTEMTELTTAITEAAMEEAMARTNAAVAAGAAAAAAGTKVVRVEVPGKKVEISTP